MIGIVAKTFLIVAAATLLGAFLGYGWTTIAAKANLPVYLHLTILIGSIASLLITFAICVAGWHPALAKGAISSSERVQLYQLRLGGIGCILAFYLKGGVSGFAKFAVETF